MRAGVSFLISWRRARGLRYGLCTGLTPCDMWCPALGRVGKNAVLGVSWVEMLGGKETRFGIAGLECRRNPTVMNWFPRNRGTTACTDDQMGTVDRFIGNDCEGRLEEVRMSGWPLVECTCCSRFVFIIADYNWTITFDSLIGE